ncbi:immunoglobulin E-set [Vibrio phage 1.031.O._10N.261.46.F8]|nr:immunoglobulin E-set [Vibrio phage 1.031.O._10N.261.46.F8]
MHHATKDDAYTISILAETTGLTDIEVVVTKPDGTDEVSNIALTEVGSKKIYEGVYTPLVVGMYYLTIVSPTETAIAGKIDRVHVSEFTNSDINTKLDTINTNVGTIQTSVDAIGDDQNTGFLD